MNPDIRIEPPSFVDDWFPSYTDQILYHVQSLWNGIPNGLGGIAPCHLGKIMQEALVEDAAIISAFFPHMSLTAAVWREWLRFSHHQPGSFQFDSVSDRVAQVATEGNPLLVKRVLQGFSPSKNSVARILIATL